MHGAPAKVNGRTRTDSLPRAPAFGYVSDREPRAVGLPARATSVPPAAKPRLPLPVEREPIVQQSPSPDAAAPAVVRRRVLVVDDEPMVVRAVSQILARSGLEVVTADGPATALARFEEFTGAIDLLLTDIVMPEGGGRRLASQLLERVPGLRVLFMSGFTDHDSVRDDRALPGPLLTKPFTAARLEAAVRDALAGATQGLR